LLSVFLFTKDKQSMMKTKQNAKNLLNVFLMIDDDASFDVACSV